MTVDGLIVLFYCLAYEDISVGLNTVTTDESDIVQYFLYNNYCNIMVPII